LQAIADLNLLGNLQSCCGTFDCNPGGLPKAYTGTFTKTFHFETVTGGVAFRSYTRYDDLQRPYSAIAESHQHAQRCYNILVRIIGRPRALAKFNHQLIASERHRNLMTISELEERIRFRLGSEYAPCSSLEIINDRNAVAHAR
jgi:hypothetical protein